MTPLAWLCVVAIVLPVSYLVFAFLVRDRRSDSLIRSNLGRGLEGGGTDGAGRKPDTGALVVLSRRLTPCSYEARLDRLLALAGRPAAMPLTRLLVAKPLLGLGGGLLGGLLIAVHPVPLMGALALFCLVLGYFVPDLLIYSRGQERQKEIGLELPNTLDQMLISVEAGLGFEQAMVRAGENGTGPLAQELVRTLQDMQVGRSRRESYQALAERSTVPDLRSFVRAVQQADTYGIAVAKVLKTQAKQMRLKRRQRAEEKAMKLPVLVLFPLLFCIFPVLFIVIMGPAVINIVRAFSGL